MFVTWHHTLPQHLLVTLFPKLFSSLHPFLFPLVLIFHLLCPLVSFLPLNLHHILTISPNPTFSPTMLSTSFINVSLPLSYRSSLCFSPILCLPSILSPPLPCCVSFTTWAGAGCDPRFIGILPSGDGGPMKTCPAALTVSRTPSS